jgi:transposase
MTVLPLSDEAWRRVSHLFSHDSRQRFGRSPRDPRDVLNAILWVTTRCEKWHQLPVCFPPWRTCYIKWLQWQRTGLMSTILAELCIENCTKSGL